MYMDISVPAKVSERWKISSYVAASSFASYGPPPVSFLLPCHYRTSDTWIFWS